MKSTSDRMQYISTQYFASINDTIQEKLNTGVDVIRLDIGSPDLPPPSEIIETLTKFASLPNHHGYNSHRGIPELREAWCDMYKRLYQVQLDPELEVLPLIGSKEGIFNLTQAFINPGEMALIPDPGYVTYTAATYFAGGVPYFLPLVMSNDYLPDFKAIPSHILEKAKLLWLNYPNNPTAASVNLEFFHEVIKFASRYDLMVCHDIAYGQIVYDGYQAPSILQVPDAKNYAVEFNTLSKSHNMAGWRVGVVVGRPDVINNLLKLKTHMDSGHFYPVMMAAVKAMEADQSWLITRNSIYQRRRDLVIKELTRMGLIAHKPNASLYVWCKVPNGMKSIDFTNAILENASVSFTPGSIFGQCGEGFMRISLTAAEENILEAMNRLARCI